MCRKVVGKYIRVHMIKSAWRSANRAAGEGDMITIDCFTGTFALMVSEDISIRAGLNKNELT